MLHNIIFSSLRQQRPMCHIACNYSSPVILSAAKDLGAWRDRSFAALRMTDPDLVMKIHILPEVQIVIFNKHILL